MLNYSFMISPAGTLYRTNIETGEAWISDGHSWIKIKEIK